MIKEEYLDNQRRPKNYLSEYMPTDMPTEIME